MIDFLDVDPDTAALPDASDDFFEDDTSPHEAAINRLAAQGIVSGTSAGTFDPGGVVSRAAMATLLMLRRSRRRAGAVARWSRDLGPRGCSAR